MFISILSLFLPGRNPSFSLCIRLAALLKLAPPQECSFRPVILDISTRLSSIRNLLAELGFLLPCFLSSSSFTTFSFRLASHCLAFSVSFRISCNISPLPLPLPLPATPPGCDESLFTPDVPLPCCFFISTNLLYTSAFLRSSSISFCLLMRSSFFFRIILILASTNSSLLAFSSAFWASDSALLGSVFEVIVENLSSSTT